MASVLTQHEETYRFLIDKLSNGWILITGDPHAVSILEECVYVPGTAYNGDFIVIFGADRYIYVGRKNDRLMKALHLVRGKAWDLLFSVRCAMQDESNITMECKHFKKYNDRKKLIEPLAESVIEDLTGGLNGI